MPRGTSFQGTHQTSAMCRCSSESNKYFKSTHTGILTEMWSHPCCCLPQSFWATRRQTHGTTPMFLHTPMLPPMLRRTSTFPGFCQTEDVQDHDDFFVPIVVPPERQWPRRVCDVYCPQIGELCIRVLLFHVPTFGDCDPFAVDLFTSFKSTRLHFQSGLNHNLVPLVHVLKIVVVFVVVLRWHVPSGTQLFCDHEHTEVSDEVKT